MEVSVPTLDYGSRLPQDGRASHLYLHTLIENNPVAVVVLDSSHCFQMCNAAFERLFQYSPAELEEWGIDALIAGTEFLAEAGDATRSVLGGRQVSLRSKRRRRDGQFVDVNIYGVPLLLDGRVQGVFGLYQEVRQRTEWPGPMPKTGVPPGWSSGEAQQPVRHDTQLSLSLELALLNSHLHRLEKLLPQADAEATEVLQQTRTLAALCGQQVRSVSRHFHRANATPGRNANRTRYAERESPPSRGMTERETEIVRLLVSGLSSKEVALRLEIGTRTVETHRTNVYRKLRLRNIADLVVYAIHHELLDVG